MLRLTDAQWDDMRVYQPCPTGIHFTGFETPAGRDEERLRTLAKVDASDSDAALLAWDALRDGYEKSGQEPEDVMVDLFSEGSLIDTFWITRQMLDRCVAAGRAALGSPA